MNRRLATSALLCLAALTLGGCGFALRQPQHLPFRSVTLSGFVSNSPLATELARALEASGVEVLETTAQAAAAASASGLANLDSHIILEARQDSRDQVVASTTAFGQVRDLSLRTRFKFRLLRADGSILRPDTELVLSRDLTYNEKDALAKQDESDALHRAMQTDIVEQVMRRLSAVSLTTAPAR
jgi:LPS-assembly lipoprotein